MQFDCFFKFLTFTFPLFSLSSPLPLLLPPFLPLAPLLPSISAFRLPVFCLFFRASCLFAPSSTFYPSVPSPYPDRNGSRWWVVFEFCFLRGSYVAEFSSSVALRLAFRSHLLPLILLPATRHFSRSFLLFGIIFLVSLLLRLYPMCHYTHPRFTVFFVPLPSPPVLEIFLSAGPRKKKIQATRETQLTTPLSFPFSYPLVPSKVKTSKRPTSTS